MQVMIQAISFFVYAIVAIKNISDFQKMSIYMFNCKTFFPILSNFENFESIPRTNLFVEVTNLMKGILYGLISPGQATIPH